MDNTEAVEKLDDSLWDERRAAYKIFTIIRGRHANEASDYVDETAQAILAAIQADPLSFIEVKSCNVCGCNVISGNGKSCRTPAP